MENPRDVIASASLSVGVLQGSGGIYMCTAKSVWSGFHKHLPPSGPLLSWICAEQCPKVCIEVLLKMITPGVRGSVCMMYFAYCNRPQPIRAVQVISPLLLGFLYIYGVEVGSSSYIFFCSSWKHLTVCSHEHIWLSGLGL